MRRPAIWVCVCVIALLAPAATALELPPQGDDETLGAYLKRVVKVGSETKVAAPGKPPAPDEAEPNAAARGQAAGEAPDAIRSGLSKLAATPAGTATSSFADRVNGTLQSFLPLVQGAVDAISTSDDKKTVTVRFNPLRAGAFGELGLSASATEPQPAEALLDLFPDDSRPGQEEAILKQLDDFSDLSFAASYNYARKLEQEQLQAARLPELRRWFFGRNPRLYEAVFAEYLGDVIAKTLKDAQANRTPEGKPRLLSLAEERERADLTDLLPEVSDETLTGAELRQHLGDGYTRYLELAVRERDALPVLQKAVAEHAKRFADLAANQPQISLTASYRDRDPLVGPDETSVNLSVEMPSEPNVNELLRSRKRSGNWIAAVDDLESRDEEIRRGTKWSVAASFVDRAGDDVLYQPAAGTGAAVSLDQARAHQFSAKLQYTRNATWQPQTINDDQVFPALHVSIERTDVSDDPLRHDRWVATVTYDLPLARGGTTPISLVYANHAEFLGDPDHRLTAHLGLNLSGLFGDQ